MGSEDLLSRTLINTMCIFDNSYDKTAIKRNLENIRNFSLDGFYNFRLGDVKKKWDEIVVLSNSYDTVINNYDTMRDFLMFLLEAIPTLVNNLSVVFDEESGFELFDEKGLRLNKLTTLSVRQEPEEDLLYNLVCKKSCGCKFLRRLAEYVRAVQRHSGQSFCNKRYEKRENQLTNLFFVLL